METWRDIKGFEGKYKVSDKGNIASVERIIKKHKYGGINLSHNRLTKDGYERVRLTNNYGVVKDFRINRIVAEAFIPNPLGKPTVNHIDGDKRNNSVENLEWASLSEQMEHAYNHKLKNPKRGYDNVNSKLSAANVKFIRKNYCKYSRTFGSVALAKRFNVTHRVILSIVKHESYNN